MPTCSYCGTELHATGKDVVCSFCNANYEDIMFSSIDFQRTKKHTINDYITSGDFEKPIQELEKFHTLDLLYGLRLTRAERSQAFYLVRLYNKASDEQLDDPGDFVAMSKEAVEMYTYWTRRSWVLENILTDRMGYYPERISDEMIDKVKLNSEKALSKKMKISSERRKS